MKPLLPNIKFLHVVRGVAALIVVFFHAKYVYWVGGKIYVQEIGLHTVKDYFLFSVDMLSSCGKECVIIFFVLSAFVIKYSHADIQKNNLLSFYKTRLLRIYLPFLFSLFFSVIVLIVCIRFINQDIYTNNLREYNSRLFAAYNELSVKQVFKTILFIENGEFAGANYAYWSLGHELIFYFLFPFYNLMRRDIKFYVGILFTVLFLLTKSSLFYYQVFFICGLILYDYFTTISKRPLIKSKPLNIGLLVIFFIAVNITNRMISETASDIVTLLYSFFIFDYILYFIKNKNTIGMRLGNISYTLYLNHLPLLLLLYSLITLQTGKLVFYNRGPYYAGVVFAVLLAVPLYYLIEKQSVKLIRRLKK